MSPMELDLEPNWKSTPIPSMSGDASIDLKWGNVQNVCWLEDEFNMQISNRVTGVQEDADSMLTQFEDSVDVVTSGYVICNRSLSLHQSYGRRLVVSRTSKDPFYCNGPSECQSGADEMCWQVVFCCCLF